MTNFFFAEGKVWFEGFATEQDKIVRRSLIREPYYSSPRFIKWLPDENGDFKYILNRKYLDLFRHVGGTVGNPGWRDCEVLGLKEYETRLNRIIKEKQLELDERLKGNKI